MPYNQTSPPGYGAGFGTNDPREQITQALMNVQYPPPSMGPPQSQTAPPPSQGPYGMPPGAQQMPQAPIGGMGAAMPAAAQPQGFAGMSQGVVAGAPQPAMPQPAMPQPMQGARY